MSIVKQQTEVMVGETKYLITALGATAGFEVLKVMTKLEKEGEALPDPEFIRKVIIKSVTVGGSLITEQKYETMFSRKQKEVIDLFQKILAFNFGSEDPNVEGVTLDDLSQE